MKLHVELYAIEQVEENLHHANEANSLCYIQISPKSCVI